MEINELKIRVQTIVIKANQLKNNYIEYKDIPVNYACIFAQNDLEYNDLLATTSKFGNIVKETPSGLLFRIEPLDTIAGELQLLKIRKADPTRPEKGDADFTVPDFGRFKQQYLNLPGFKLIPKDGFVMIELMYEGYDVRAYFSNPPLDVQLGIK